MKNCFGRTSKYSRLIAWKQSFSHISESPSCVGSQFLQFNSFIKTSGILNIGWILKENNSSLMTRNWKDTVKQNLDIGQNLIYLNRHFIKNPFYKSWKIRFKSYTILLWSIQKACQHLKKLWKFIFAQQLQLKFYIYIVITKISNSKLLFTSFSIQDIE